MDNDKDGKNEDEIDSCTRKVSEVKFGKKLPAVFEKWEANNKNDDKGAKDEPKIVDNVKNKFRDAGENGIKWDIVESVSSS